MKHRVAWAIFALAILLVLAGFWLILASLGWLGLHLWFLSGPLGVLGGVLFALVGCLFVVAGVAAIAVSMSIRMYSAQEIGETNLEAAQP